MRIFRSIGLGIFLLTTLIMMPKVYKEMELTAISFLQGARLSADTASRITASAAASLPAPGTSSSSSSSPQPRIPFAFPQTPTIPNY